MNTLPTHIAMVMDGNRRWAAEKGLPKMVGHTKGAQNIKPVLQKCLDLEIPYVTLWALSTENLKKRSEKELDHLFSLFGKLIDYLSDFIENNVQLRIAGDISALPQNVQDSLNGVVEKTAGNAKMTLVLAVNYGGRDEIIRAIKKIIDEGVVEEDVTEALVGDYLDTAGIPEPDLIIRTGGHQRLSGYLPWQSVYAELYFTETYWPAFTPNKLQEAVDWYATVQRNKGK